MPCTYTCTHTHTHAHTQNKVKQKGRTCCRCHSPTTVVSSLGTSRIWYSLLESPRPPEATQPWPYTTVTSVTVHFDEAQFKTEGWREKGNVQVWERKRELPQRPQHVEEPWRKCADTLLLPAEYSPSRDPPRPTFDPAEHTLCVLSQPMTMASGLACEPSKVP